MNRLERWIYGWLLLAEGFTRVVTFTMYAPNWTFDWLAYVSNRGMKKMEKAVKKLNERKNK